MDQVRFWAIIERNRGNPKKVEAALAKLPPEEIAAWRRMYYDHHNALHRWDLWGAAYVINGGCGNDGFHYFKAWLIGRGRKVYEAAMRDPDSVGRFVTFINRFRGCENELLNYAAEEAYERRMGKEMEQDRNSNEFDEPAGARWTEDNVLDLFPKLAAKFAKNWNRSS